MKTRTITIRPYNTSSALPGIRAESNGVILKLRDIVEFGHGLDSQLTFTAKDISRLLSFIKQEFPEIKQAPIPNPIMELLDDWASNREEMNVHQIIHELRELFRTEFQEENRKESCAADKG